MKKSILNKTLLPLVLAFVFSIQTITIASASTAFAVQKADGLKIENNVYIGEVDVSGLTSAEALAALKAKHEAKLKSMTMTFVYKNSNWSFKYAELGIANNYSAAIASALKLVRAVPAPSTTPAPDTTTAGAIETTTGAGIQPTSTTTAPAIEYKRIDLKLDFSMNQKVLSKVIDGLSSKLTVKPINAMLKVTDNRFEIVPDKAGLELDKASLQKKISQAISKATAVATRLALPTKAVKAKYTSANLLEVHDKLAEFSTRFDPTYTNRVVNIKLAAKNVTNLVLMPNEVLSIDKAMGPRDEELGYLPAHVIIGNKMVDGIAGGICQVSTTLYNAALYSNLEIVERSNHSLPSAYVKLGRDATVNGTNKDLKIRNNTGYPIYIVNKMDKNHLIFTIYGKNVYPQRRVVLKTNILSSTKATITYINDPTLPKGKKLEELPASTAYTVETFREVYDGKKLLSVEKLDLDRYRLVNGIIRIGTKED